MRRWLVVALAALLAAVALAIAGPPELRPWRCHHIAEYSTAREAATTYYANCWGGPNRLIGPRDGGKVSTPYAAWFALDEFTATYRGGKIRFLLVGKRSEDVGWRVLPPEGTGP